LCDLSLEEPNAEHALTMIAKMFAMYGYEPGLSLVASIARRFPDSFWISVAFGMYGDPQHPQGPDLIELMREPLPTGFVAVVTLDLANTLCRQGRLASHPFDTPAGHTMLESWLTDTNPEHFSYALSSAAALPFVNDDVRGRLANLAFEHPDPKVQMEAAWASAYRGNEAGLKFLARMSTDVRMSVTARHYLEELDRLDVMPDEANDPNFQAMARMCDWLAHPNECGRPPDEIDVYDTREMYWPPTDDTRQVWLFRYRYKNANRDGTDDVGISMVGSVTFALFGEATADLCPEDVYGLHCCWELECNQDPRAPDKRTAKAGRELLGI
jgi:hypothetical protein